MGYVRRNPRRRWERASFSVWLPAITMMMVSALSHIDRNTLALLAPSVLRGLQITNEEYGYVISRIFDRLHALQPAGERMVVRLGVRAP